MTKKTLEIAILLVIAIGTGFSEIPRSMNYQAKLTNDAGVALAGDHSITFRLYDALSGGNLQTEETQTITVTNGLFDATLDFSTSPRDTLSWDKPYWLELEIAGEVLTPREPITAVGYAFRAVYADTAEFAIGGGGSDGDWEVTGSDMYSLPAGNVGIGTSSPDASAKLHIESTSSGMLIPRMTEIERDAISSPANALLIYNTTSGCLQIYNSTETFWENVYCYDDCSPRITSHPIYQTICDGGNTAFSVIATGLGLTYQWQVDEGSGFADITAAGTDPVYANWTTSSLNVNSVDAANDGYLYRCIVSGDCEPPAISNSAELTVLEAPSAPVATAATDVEAESFTANWESVAGALYYQLDVSTASDFSSYVTGYENLNVGDATSYSAGGLSVDNTYYYRVSVVTACGTSIESNIITAYTSTCPLFLEVGDVYGGGVVVYTSYPSPCGYLIISPDEICDTALIWGCMGSEVGGTSSSIGTGAANTSAIVSACHQPGIPAMLCEVYSGGGFTDWFLPSRSELSVIADADTSILYPALRSIGGEGLKFSYYWSSTEGGDPANEAYNHHMWMDLGYYNLKTSPNRLIRAVRSF